MSVSQQDQLTEHQEGVRRLCEGVYLTDGTDLFWIVGWTKLGALVEDCRTGDVRWKHVQKIDEMEVVTPR